jgi:F-type H+-transporting ATPase subunit a
MHPGISSGAEVLSRTVATTWALMAALAVGAWASTRRLSLDPGPLQTALEGIVSGMEAAIAAVLPDQSGRVFPFVATLWIFVLASNLTGIVPGLHSPTADLSTTAALAVLVFLSVHWFGVEICGFKSYLRHFLRPSPVLLPINLIGEVSRTVALAVRLFGNMFSLELAALLMLLVAGFLVPVALNMLHIVEAVVQAYIFGMLALIYIAGGIQSEQAKHRKEGAS